MTETLFGILMIYKEYKKTYCTKQKSNLIPYHLLYSSGETEKVTVAHRVACQPSSAPFI